MIGMEDEYISRIVIHAIDEAIYKLGIRLCNEEWIVLVEWLNVIEKLEL